MPVFCIVFLQLSLLNFSLCLVARFKALSNSSLRTNNEYMYISIFSLFIVCLFSSEGVRAVAAPFFRKCGENVAYRMLSFTLTHIPIAAIAANRLIIIVMFIFLKPFLSFFSILKSSTQSSFYTIFQTKNLNSSSRVHLYLYSLLRLIATVSQQTFTLKILFHLSVSKPSFNLIALKTLMPYFLKPNLYYYS